jgi:hypothetical protein
MDRLQAQVKRHDAKAALPIIIPLPIDDDPFKCIEDNALERPRNLASSLLSLDKQPVRRGTWVQTVSKCDLHGDWGFCSGLPQCE